MFWRRRQLEREMEEELQFHLEKQIEDLVQRGVAPNEARRIARNALGGVERRKDEMREARGIGPLENVLRDAKYALRTLRRSPGFAAIAIVTLALGIGANSTIFTLVNAVLVRPLPYDNPSRLVVVQYERSETVAPGVFLDWKAASRSFERMSASEYWTPNWTGGDQATELTAIHVGADLLPMLGVRPMLGRWFSPNEEHSGQDKVVILRNDLWRSRFAADSGVIGRAMMLDGEPYTIVGVLPAGFEVGAFFASGAQLYAPFVLDDKRADRASSSMRVFAQLKPGVSLEQARVELTTIAAGLERQFPGTNQGVTAVPLHTKETGSVRDPLLILLVAVGLVLLITCVNVAHLQLMRGASREREFAVRASLGGTQSRLFQQSIVESLILALGGVALGLVLARVAIRVLVVLAPSGLPRLGEVRLDGAVLVVTLLTSLIAAIGFGVVPALTASRADVNVTLQEGGRTGHDGRRRRTLRGVLVVSEFALALVLLAGAGLVIRSFAALTSVRPGFDADRTLAMRVSLRGTTADDPVRRHAFFRDLIDRVKLVPGVADASAINHVPLNGDDWHFPFAIEGRPPAAPGAEDRAQFLIVRPGYFRTMGIPLHQGRDFTAQDEAVSAQNVIINDVMARRFWPGASALGQRITVDDVQHPNWFTVVGVIGDVRQGSLAANIEPQMYFPSFTGGTYTWKQHSLITYLSPESMTLVVRTAGDQTAALAAVQSVVTAMEKNAPIAAAMTMRQALGLWLTAPRFYLLLLGSFAGVAVLLAAVGVYGVISYSVAQRTHEIGVRMALGASARTAFGLVVQQGMRLALLGGAIGLVVALLATRWLRAMLYGVGPTDPLSFALAAALLTAVALGACALPALRASRVDPMTAVRSE